MAGMSIGARIGSNPAIEALRNQQFQNQAKRQNQLDQNEIARKEFERNALTAQGNALNQAHAMQSNPENPRTVTDTSMTIGNNGSILSGKVNSSQMSGGTTKMLPPNLEGRFMNLLEGNGAKFQKPTDLNMGMPPRETMPAASFSPTDATAFQEAQFSRLKDKAGLLGRSAVNSLSSELAGRGISGASGAFGKGLADIVSQTTQPLADLNVAHLGEQFRDSQLARQMAEQRSATEFSGALQQRGQDFNQQNALNALKMSLSDREFESDLNSENIWRQLLQKFL